MKLSPWKTAICYVFAVFAASSLSAHIAEASLLTPGGTPGILTPTVWAVQGTNVFNNLGTNVGVGTTTPGSIFSIGGVANFSTGTTTFYGSGGINLAAGCFAVNGTCVTGGGGGNTFGYPFPGNATTTVLSFGNGIVLGASTTLSYLGAGALYTDLTGKLLTQATTSSSQAFQGVWRDGNQNAFAQNFVSAATSFPTNGGTISLTNASPRVWIFNGVNSQTMQLPNATTLTTGWTFSTNNNASGVVTVVDNGSNTLALVPSGGSVILTASSTATANGVWDAHAYLGHNNVSGTGTLGIGTTTPWGDFSVNSLWNATGPIFVAATSTLTGSTTVFQITQSGIASTTGIIASWLHGGVVYADASGSTTATSSIGTNLIANPTISGINLGGTLGALTATNGSLTFSGSYTGAAAQTVGINLANDNTWTGQQLFNGKITGIGTTTPWAALSVSTTSQQLASIPLFDVGSTTNADLFNVLGNGNVGIGSTSPGTLLSITSAPGKGINLGVGTSTFTGLGGINLVTGAGTSGCFAINGTCVGGGGSGTVTQIIAAGGLSGGTITNSGTIAQLFQLGTSTAETGGQLAAWGTTSGTPAKLYSIATSSAICSGGLQCSGFTVVGSVSPTISIAGPVVLGNGGTNNATWTTGGVVFSTATTLTNGSTFFWDNTTKDLGIGSSTPWATLSVSTTSQSTGKVALFAVASTTNATLFDILGNGNVGIATSSPAFPLSVNGAGSDFYIASNGEVVGRDQTNTWNGRISPTHNLSVSAGTSTATWTGTSTPGIDVAAPAPATFKGIIRGVRCNSNTFLGVQIKVNSTIITPAYFVASSTVGHEIVTGNNTFNAGDIITVNFGTTTTAVGTSPVYALCNIDTTETP